MNEEQRLRMEAIFAEETLFLRIVEQQVKTFLNGNEFGYRSIMLHIAMARSFGQCDGALQTSDTDFNKAFAHILAEFNVKSEEYTRLGEEYKRRVGHCRATNEASCE